MGSFLECCAGLCTSTIRYGNHSLLEYDPLSRGSEEYFVRLG
ncbi:hypothetical protein VCHENC02_5952A, partial [Vibrio harveyi]